MHKSIPLSKAAGGLAHQCESDFDMPPIKTDSEEVVPISQQYPDMSIFEKFCPETTLNDDPQFCEKSDAEKSDESQPSLTPPNELHQSGSNPALKGRGGFFLVFFNPTKNNHNSMVFFKKSGTKIQ